MKLYICNLQICKQELYLCVYIYKANIDEYCNQIIPLTTKITLFNVVFEEILCIRRKEFRSTVSFRSLHLCTIKLVFF